MISWKEGTSEWLRINDHIKSTYWRNIMGSLNNFSKSRANKSVSLSNFLSLIFYSVFDLDYHTLTRNKAIIIASHFSLPRPSSSKLFNHPFSSYSYIHIYIYIERERPIYIYTSCWSPHCFSSGMGVLRHGRRHCHHHRRLSFAILTVLAFLLLASASATRLSSTRKLGEYTQNPSTKNSM